MLILHHYKKKLACMAIAGCIAAYGYAQGEMYFGGYHDGFTAGVQNNFSPQALDAQSVYQGGNDDGYNMAAVNAFAPAMPDQFTPYTSSLSGDGYSAAEHHDYDRQFLTQYTPYTSSVENDGYADELAVGQALPIELISFKGTTEGKTSLLQWAVADEKDIIRYELERAGENGAYKVIYVNNIATPSANETHREYADKQPLTGKNFYRLKITERNGKLKYSNVVLLIFNGTKNTLIVYPNPAKNFVTITGSASIQSVELTDMSGRKLKQFAATYGNQYPLNGVKSGMYILRVKAGDDITSIRLLVQ